MSAVLLLIFLTVALRVIPEVLEIVRTPPRRSERAIKRERRVDAWIAGHYPQRFVGEHGDEPRIRSERWGPFLRGDRTTPEQLDELVIEGAFELEFRARRMFAGAQFKGILQGATSVVWSRRAAVELEKLFAAHEPGPAARKCLDRALGWWRAAIGRGVRVFEWDRPGYDEVTEAFLELPRFAREEVRVNPAAHGVEVKTTIETIPGEPSPSILGPVLRIVVLLLIAGIGAWALLASERDSRPMPEPIDCAVQKQKVLQAAAEMRLEIAADGERTAVLDEVVAAVQVDDVARARALWSRVKDRSTESVLLNARLLLLASCEPK